jgi:uncharacterized membrane protein YhaH (DUF805 family)
LSPYSWLAPWLDFSPAHAAPTASALIHWRLLTQPIMRFPRSLSSLNAKIEEKKLMTLAQWFSFNGRIRRKTWWIFYFLIPILMSLLLGILSLFIAWIFLIQPNLARLMELIGNTITRDQFAIADIFLDRTVIWIGIVFYGPTLPLAWLWLSGSIKRFHDLNINWYLLAIITVMNYFYSVVSFFYFFAIEVSFADPVSSSGLNSFWSFIIDALEIIVFVTFLLEFLVLGFLRGTPGPNRFGPDPPTPPDAANIALPPQPQ